MFRALAAFAVLFATAAPAQVITSYTTNNPTATKGDADKIVCKKEEKIGTRLSAKKVCLTVAEWQAREGIAREHTERIQGGTPSCGNPPCLSGEPF
jgi:hypothetical protein